MPDGSPGPFGPVLDAAPWPDAQPAPAAPWSRTEDALPPEIARIAEGAVTLFKGGLMNAGRQTWYALDLQRRCFLAVLRQSGAGLAPRPGARPVATCPAATESLHQASASAAQCQAFAALAQRLLACADAQDGQPEPLPQGPLRRSLLLLHQGQALALPGGAAAQALRAEIIWLIQQPLQQELLGPDPHAGA